MKFLKKSLGQNFLVDKNIIKKIVYSLELKNKDIVEIGPGNGALTNEILKCNPKSLVLIEKDNNLAKYLKEKYSNTRHVKIYNSDILKFDIEKHIKKKSIVYGNLPYNISSQILVKFLKLSKWPPQYNDLIFMFQKELGEKIMGNYPGKNYGRLSILTNLKLSVYKSFFVSPNCFHPKPKVDSTVIHFKPRINTNLNIKNINNLEKITNIFFSNKRKMINKNIKKILNKNQISLLLDLDLSLRPAEIGPEMYYKITELYEEK